MTDQPDPPPCTREAVIDALSHQRRPLKRYDVVTHMYRRHDGTVIDKIHDLPPGSAVPHLRLIDQMLKDGTLVQLPGPTWRKLLGPNATPPSANPGNYYLATRDQHEKWAIPLFTVIGLRRDSDPGETLVTAVLDFPVADAAWCSYERQPAGWTTLRATVRARTADDAEASARTQWSADAVSDSEVTE
ncbi:hypothetical protein ABZV92_19740 [Streptomyces rubiginosohelvolus]|uniref:hypothetical protein n=1 Tax=Streptomyces rubiginosohelvolus TaxID=67362 RepID=UPI00339E5F90